MPDLHALIAVEDGWMAAASLPATKVEKYGFPVSRPRDDNAK